MSKKTKGRLTRDGATVRRVQVMLDDATTERAKELGDGNLSLGIRQAVAILPTPARQNECGMIAAQGEGPLQPMMPGRREAESSQEASMDQQVLIARNLRGVQVGDTLRVERGQVFKGAEKASFDITSRVAPDGKYVVRAKCGRAPGDVSYYG